MKKNYLIFLLLAFYWVACQEDTLVEEMPPPIEIPEEETTLPAGTEVIPASTQRSGDPDRGYNYLVTGDYVNSGPPVDLYLQLLGSDDGNILNRAGKNAQLPHYLNAVKAANGVEVTAANCLVCHSESLNGELIIGLGNNSVDYTQNQGGLNDLISSTIALTYGENSAELQAYEPFRRATAVLSDQLLMEVQGVNPAGKLAVILGAHRQPDNLEWRETPQYTIPERVIPSDVPPWWHTRKKNALYYTGVGRGDHSRTIMAASISTLQDTAEARKIDQFFPDVLAFLKTIEPPTYPLPVNSEQVARGQEIFEEKCANCHGTYGTMDTYPNLLVDLDVIKTDPLLATSNYGYEGFLTAYNESWFGQGTYRAELVATNGYIAPPLDGIWATAPYLHNGSVPTLEDLLNSEQRPTYWERTFDNSDLDYEKVGWNYTQTATANSTKVYDTTLLGYGNQGHIYGDRLSVGERSDLIEYLKTL